MEQEKVQRQYFVANGPEGLKEVLAKLKRINTENSTKSAQYDIIFLHNSLTALLKVDMSRPQVKFWYHDFGFGRAAPTSVKDVVVGFIRPTLKKEDTRDEEILVVHFDDRSLDKNKSKQRAAGFFNVDGKMDIESDDDFTLDDLQDTEISQLTSDLQRQDVPNMDARQVASLLRAQKDLDTLASPATEYGKSGRYRTLFDKPETQRAPEEGERSKPSKPFSNSG
jgi:hypothetical protein